MISPIYFILLIAIPLGTCEKAKLVNTGSQKHVQVYLKILYAEKIPNPGAVLKEPHHPGP